MKFRDMDIDEIKVIGPLHKEPFEAALYLMHKEYNVIDLQYSMVMDNRSGEEVHSALALVQSKAKPVPTPKPTKGLANNGD